MATFSAEDRVALLDSLGRLLAAKNAEADVRRVMETADGYDRDLWRNLADMGIVGLIIAEDFGGAGGGPVELEAVMESAGAALLCAPLLASGVLAAHCLSALGDEAAKARLLPDIAAGRTIATLALTGDGGCWTAEGVAVAAAEDSQGWRLDGAASYVIHGQSADVLLVLAGGPAGLRIFEVDPADPGVAIATLPTFDHTLRLARIAFTAARARPLDGAVPAWEAVQRALNLALVALAGEQAGGARRCLEMTVDYARRRIQFGRPIGSFQAIKHMASDLLLESESAVSAARDAAHRLAEDGPGADAAVSLAAFACADAFTTTTAASIQMHGGIAFTWAHPAHLYLRRARADAHLLGTPAFHRERFIQHMGG